MSRITNLFRWPWRKRKPESSVAVGVLGTRVYICPPEDLGPGRFRSFIDPNKIYTIAEPKEPVSQ